MRINYLVGSLVHTSQATDTGKAHLYSSYKNQDMMTKNAFFSLKLYKDIRLKVGSTKGYSPSVFEHLLHSHATQLMVVLGHRVLFGWFCFFVVVRRRHSHVLSITSPLSFREIQPQVDFFAFFPKGVSWCPPPYLNVCKFHANSSFCLPCASKVPDAALETFTSVK